MSPCQPLSRRTALAAGLGAAGLAGATVTGCSVRLPGHASETASPKLRPDQIQPDVQIVVDLVAALRQSVALLQDTGTRHPQLSPQLASLLTAQKAHLEVLHRAAPADRLAARPPVASRVPARASKALAAVLERTRVLRQECYTSAARAESGSFARLLASIGASLSQRLVVLAAAR